MLSHLGLAHKGPALPKKAMLPSLYRDFSRQSHGGYTVIPSAVIETLFVPADPAQAHISSTLIAGTAQR